MIFTYNNKKSIFIHIPKTGGNYIQTLFQINKMSIDSIVKNHSDQDGIDRFEVNGILTEKKHQTLREYYEKDSTCMMMPIYSCIRKPFERLVSFYFSPFRWVKYDSISNKFIYPKEVNFVEEEFVNLVNILIPAWRYLSLSEFDYVSPQNNIRILRTESLNKDLSIYFPNTKLPSRKINTSFYQDQSSLIRKSIDLRNFVETSRHKKDLEIFY